MNASRRIGRMTRHKSTLPKLNLTPLMDVFTVLVFFLMFNLNFKKLPWSGRLTF